MQIPQKHYLFARYATLTISIFVLHVQAQTGFVNIDCGYPANLTYVDTNTELIYESDASYIDSGVSKPISATFTSDSIDQQLRHVRSFPEGTRNCYTLSSPVGKNTTFLIRARFLYGNYDGLNQLPEFDLYLGISLWDTIKVEDASKVINKEIIHVINTDYLYLCLIDKKSGVPFISAIELRKLKSGAYTTDPPTSLMTYFRYDFGSSAKDVVRYGDDIYDRFWSPYPNFPSWTTISTNLPIDSNQQSNDYFPGSAVMKTAVVPKHPSQPLSNISWEPDDSETNFYYYLHFAEIQQLQTSQSRSFNLTLNGEIRSSYIEPDYLYTTTIYSPKPRSRARFDFALVRTANSTLPPLINAIEVYTTRNITESQTVQGDVDALQNIKSAYGVKKIWQGDPCAPETSAWDGVQCSNNVNNSSIISLNLPSSNLTGNISSYILNLKSLQILDLSHNNLTGQVPGFLTQLENLKVINLTDNNLTGTIPQQLLQMNGSSTIILRLDGNPNLCLSDSCQSNNMTSNNSNKHKRTLIAVGASLGAAFIIAIAIAIVLFLYINNRRKPRGSTSVVDEAKRGNLDKNHKQFTYSEVLRTTSNFQKVIGNGGFGMVYLGYMDSTPIAVKMLSPSSIQGYREFQVEVELLMRVHHKNLTSLIGYCDENGNMGLIYEYMANGNLEKHLSERSPNILGWEKRIQIAYDAAQGLDYLHKGCKPPIIHRDVKTTNILLDENFQAKVADFGLSRVFPINGKSHVTTTIAGTPGYLDPEYYKTNWLNEKSDVYSFGIVLLRIITGRRVIERAPIKTHIATWVKSMISTGDITKIVDPRLGGYFDVNCAWKILELAIDCSSNESIKRPTMNQVVSELQQCLALARMQNFEDSPIEKSSMTFNSEPGTR